MRTPPPGSRAGARGARGRICLSRGDHIGAATDAGIVFGLDPYRESAHNLLMRAHIYAGNPSQAVVVYEGLRTMLSNDLETVPSAETEATLREASGG